MTQPVIHGTVAPVRRAAADAPLVVLGPSLGTTTELWDAVTDDLAADYRVLRFDLPGHQLSPATTLPFTVAELATAVIDLVDSVGGGSFHYAGISFGGAIGLELALRYPERIASLTVMCSGAKIGDSAGWIERAGEVRASGMRSAVAGSAERWFAPGFLERDPDAGAKALERLLDIDDESYALCCEALAEFDVRSEAAGITAATLCVSGEFDRPTPVASLHELATSIPGAHEVTISGAAHLPALERPAVVASLLLDHLAFATAAGSSEHD